MNLLDEGIGDTLVLSRRDERSFGAQANTKVLWWFVTEGCILRVQRESRKDQYGE